MTLVHRPRYGTKWRQSGEILLRPFNITVVLDRDLRVRWWSDGQSEYAQTWVLLRTGRRAEALFWQVYCRGQPTLRKQCHPCDGVTSRPMSPSGEGGLRALWTISSRWEMWCFTFSSWRSDRIIGCPKNFAHRLVRDARLSSGPADTWTPTLWTTTTKTNNNKHFYWKILSSSLENNNNNNNLMIEINTRHAKKWRCRFSVEVDFIAVIDYVGFI